VSGADGTQDGTKVAVGTSGYSYKEWKPSFYPKELKPPQMLTFYGERFPTVEINNTFYQMPKAETLEAQAAQVPPAFTFAFKAPGRITHQKRMKDVAEPVQHLWETVAVLGARLGPVLYGLPPNMKKDVGRLAAVLAMTPAGRRVAVEFRHESWFDDETYDVLRAAGAALCIADAPDFTVPFVATAPWGYVRLRKVDYDAAEIASWAAKVRGAGWSDAVVYFKHEDTGSAPVLAEQLRKALAE
jgi:uncharacterized protein YecE (DUF72 family)